MALYVSLSIIQADFISFHQNILLNRIKYGMKTNKTCFKYHTLWTMNTQINKFYFYNWSVSLSHRRALICLLFNVSSRNSKRIANVSCIDERVNQTRSPLLLSYTVKNTKSLKVHVSCIHTGESWACGIVSGISPICSPNLPVSCWMCPHSLRTGWFYDLQQMTPWLITCSYNRGGLNGYSLFLYLCIDREFKKDYLSIINPTLCLLGKLTDWNEPLLIFIILLFIVIINVFKYWNIKIIFKREK